jgi:hypothetical protein
MVRLVSTMLSRLVATIPWRQQKRQRTRVNVDTVVEDAGCVVVAAARSLASRKNAYLIC